MNTFSQWAVHQRFDQLAFGVENNEPDPAIPLETEPNSGAVVEGVWIILLQKISARRGIFSGHRDRIRKIENAILRRHAVDALALGSSGDGAVCKPQCIVAGHIGVLNLNSEMEYCPGSRLDRFARKMKKKHTV